LICDSGRWVWSAARVPDMSGMDHLSAARAFIDRTDGGAGKA